MSSESALIDQPGYIPSLIADAYQRIQSQVLRTPLVRDEVYGLWLKCENEQKTGSFKWRGALSRLSQIPAGQAIVTASTGNHGLGVAKAAELYGLKATIFIPSSAAPKKIEKLRALGADLHLVDGDSLQAELTGKAYAQENQLPWVSPYNDPEVIAGQGTIGLELMSDLPHIEKVYVTVGGGGLVSGIASWIKWNHPETEIIGCQPVNSPEMFLSVKAGHVVDDPDARPTLSDGSAGPLEADSITFPICSRLIDRFILIDEAEIERAIHHLYDAKKLIVEGAAGVAMAAAMKDINRRPDQQSVVILCGSNIDPAVHQRICGY